MMEEEEALVVDKHRRGLEEGKKKISSFPSLYSTSVTLIRIICEEEKEEVRE